MPTASPHSTRGPSRSTQELQNPSNELAYRGIWTERLARGFPPLQGKTSDSICTKEFRAQPSLIWVPRQRAVQALGLAVLASKGREASRASPTDEHSMQSQASGKLDQGTGVSGEPILQPHEGREPSQSSYPDVLSQQHLPLLNLSTQPAASPSNRPW